MIKKRKTPTKVVKEKSDELVPVKNGSRTAFFVLIIIVVVATAAVLMVSNRMNKNKGPQAMGDQPNAQQTEKSEAPAMNKGDISVLINRVSQLIVVKQGEEPTVATVQDSEMLKNSNPVFYKDVENGDRLLVWSDKAVLYSVKQDKLLSVMPILGDQSAPVVDMATSTASQADAPTTDEVKEDVTIEVRNGTRTGGLAKSASDSLKDKGYTVGSIGDAIGKAYEKTMVIKTSEATSTATVSALQTALDAEVVELPTGELAGKADVLVIIGANYQP